MYDESQSIIADYLLRYRSVPLMIWRRKQKAKMPPTGMQQASRYARRLSIRFSLATNGTDWILTDNETEDYETFSAPPTPEEIVTRFGVSIDWGALGGDVLSIYHVVRSREGRQALPRCGHQQGALAVCAG